MAKINDAINSDDERNSALSTIYEEFYENEEFEGYMQDPLEQVIPQQENNMTVFFNIASLFRSSHFTVTPVQFADNAKQTHRWSNVDDNKLLKAFQKYENNWTKIQHEMRIAKCDVDDIKNRYEKITTANVKGTWTTEEDAIILREYAKFGRNWGIIAKKISGRTGKQVRERYVNYLEKKDNIKKEEFTEDEDELILRYFELFPHDWDKIAQNIPTKSAALIKKRFVNYLKDKRFESLSTLSATMSNHQVDIDTVNEITNSVDSLIDPIGDFFRQRLSLMKSSSIQEMEDDIQGTNLWLLKKSSLEESKAMMHMFENQGMLGVDLSSQVNQQKEQYQKVNSYYNRTHSQASSNFFDDEQSQQDPEYQKLQQSIMSQDSLERKTAERKSIVDKNDSNNLLVPNSLLKPQRTAFQKSNQFKKSNSSTKPIQKYQKENSATALRLNSQVNSIRSKMSHYTDETPRNGNTMTFDGNSVTGGDLFDFDYLLQSEQSINIDRSDCDSIFDAPQINFLSPRDSMKGFGIQISQFQS